MSDSIQMLVVSSVPAADVEKGKLQIIARARATKGGPAIAPEQRSRSIIIPEYQPAVSSKYASIVCSALATAATEQLRSLWAQGDPQEVAAALFNEDCVLAYCAREAESSRLTKDTITAWWNDSSFKKFCVGKFSEKAIGSIIGRLQNLSAPSPDYTEKQALQAIALFGEVADIDEDEFAQRLIMKLQGIVEKIAKQREELAEDTPF